MDIMFVRHLLVDRPFEAPHGKGTSAWESTAHYLSLAVDPDGNLIFPLGCNGRQLKSRYQELMSAMKKIQSEVPFRSGCDDDEVASDLQTGLEELLQMHSSASSAAANTNAASTANKEEDKRNAESMRRASMGTMTPKERRDLQNGKKRKTTAPCVSPPPISNDPAVMMDSFTEDIEARIEDRKQKRDSNRNEKHALKAKQIELEKERFRLQEETAKKQMEMDQVREDRIFRLQEQSLQLQADMFRFFQQHVPKTTTTNEDDDKNTGTLG
jgi:hypothetical protein